MFSKIQIAAEHLKNRAVGLNRRSPLRPRRFISALAWNYVKSALRVIRRQKAYSVINIAGLAVGIAAYLLILLWVRDELSYDKFHANYRDICLTIPELQSNKVRTLEIVIIEII